MLGKHTLNPNEKTDLKVVFPTTGSPGPFEKKVFFTTNIPGQEKIEIVDKTGGNSIKIDSIQNNVSITSAMQLKIKAKMISIESDTTMAIKAGATIEIQGALVKIN